MYYCDNGIFSSELIVMEKIYFKNVNGKKSKPFTIDELNVRGNLYENDLIWSSGLGEWTKAKEIEELKAYALSEPPKTEFENRMGKLRFSFFTSLKYYIIVSLFIGIFSALLEKYQYQDFVNSIEKIDHSNDSNNSVNIDGKVSLVNYSNIRSSEIYASKADGSRYTRWTTYGFGNQDNEQLSYNYSYKFLFRPFNAIFGVANLSTTERENYGILIINFLLSSFVSNVFLIPLFFILLYFIPNRNE